MDELNEMFDRHLQQLDRLERRLRIFRWFLVLWLLLCVLTLLLSCGEDGEGFFCIQGTEEECALVAQAQRAFARCGVFAYQSEFWFFHEGDEECARFGSYCGFNMQKAVVWINQCKPDGCKNLPKYIVHEPLHEEWLEFNPHSEEMLRVQNEILSQCWEEEENGTGR